MSRAGLRHVGAPGRLIIWFPFKLIFFKLFWAVTGLTKLLRVRAQITDNFQRNSFAHGNTSLLAPYLQLFQ
jgi:hypothetical protein